MVLRPASGPFVFSSLSLSLIFSRSFANRIDRLRARQWQQLFFADNDFFEISDCLSLSLSLCVSTCARVSFSVPANLDKRLVSKCYLARGDGWREREGGRSGGLLRPFCRAPVWKSEESSAG